MNKAQLIDDIGKVGGIIKRKKQPNFSPEVWVCPSCGEEAFLPKNPIESLKKCPKCNVDLIRADYSSNDVKQEVNRRNKMLGDK